MNIPEETWKILMLGGFAGLLYCSLIHPPLSSLFQKLRILWHMHRSARLSDAEARGYGWAWASVMVECASLDSVESQIHPFTSFDDVTQIAFDRGATKAIEDIKYFLCLREEREKDT